jgi:hypothetical protein
MTIDGASAASWSFANGPCRQSPIAPADLNPEGAFWPELPAAKLGGTWMHKLVLAALMVVVVAVAACSSGPSAPTPSPAPSAPVASPTPAPSPTPDPSATPGQPSPTPPASPQPTPEPSPSAPAEPTFTIDEQWLLAGIRRGAIDCKPIRTGLPTGATGGIECRSDNLAVPRIGFYEFDGPAEMVEAYLARMKAEGIELKSYRGCHQGEGEGAYVPGEGESINPYRAGCFVNAEGFANYRFTTGDRVYVGILGRSADMGVLEDFAWLGNQDTPGAPTLWVDPGW